MQLRQRIGVISVRGADYPPTRRLGEAAQARGCAIAVVHPYQVWPVIRQGRPMLAGDSQVNGLSAVLPRQGAEIRDACLPLIAHLERMGVTVINKKAAVEKARNKFVTLQCLAAAALPVSDTIFVTSMDGYREAFARLGQARVVVKPVAGRQGEGIVRLQAPDPLPPQLQLELEQGRGLLVQHYIAPQGRQDLRLLVIGQKVAAAMRLRPAADDFRANYHLSHQGEAFDPPPALIQLALAAVQALELDIAGVDIMVAANGLPLVNEVNYAPGFHGLEMTTGQDIAGAILDYVLAAIQKG